MNYLRHVNKIFFMSLRHFKKQSTGKALYNYLCDQNRTADIFLLRSQYMTTALTSTLGARRRTCYYLFCAFVLLFFICCLRVLCSSRVAIAWFGWVCCQHFSLFCCSCIGNLFTPCSREKEIARTIERSTAAVTGLLACGRLRNDTLVRACMAWDRLRRVENV